MKKELLGAKINLSKNKKAAAAVLSLLSAVATVGYFGLTASSVFTFVLLFLGCFLIKKSLFCNGQKIKIAAVLVGGVLALLTVLGKVVSIAEQSPGIKGFAFFVVYLSGFWIVFTAICKLLFSRLITVTLTCEEGVYPAKKRCALVFFGSAAVILLAWLPYFLSEYPGNLTPDSNSQLLQALGKEPLSNHHPFIHTLLIRGILNIGLGVFNGNQNSAVALYCGVQAVMLALCFSYLVETLFAFRFKKWCIALVVAYFALVPYHALYSITIWKDVLFGGIVLVLTVVLWRIIKWYKTENTGHPVFELVLFFVFGLLMCLFRSNGWYAYLLLAVLLLLFFWKKSIPLVLSVIITIGCAFVVKGPVFKAMDITPPDAIESLSVPAQHISRAICDGYVLTDEEYDLLSQVVEVEKIPETYNASLSDPIKALVREKDNQEYLNKNKSKFLGLWFKIGIKNPTSYIFAQIDQTIGYWYPDIEYWVYTTYIEANEELGCFKDSKLNVDFVLALRRYVQGQRDVPVLSLLWSIGTFTWLIIVLAGLSVIKKTKEFWLVFVPVVAIILTLFIATPVHAEFRYAYSMFTTVPFLLLIPFFGNDGMERKR